jgi:hypothetical protein
MKLSELVAKLQALQEEWGDIRVVCSPHGYETKPPILLTPGKHWCNRAKPITLMVREPSPTPWGLPGLGCARPDGNPALEITL